MNASSKIWVNPHTVVKLFTKTILARAPKPTNEEVLMITRLRKLRVTSEAWRAAMYLVALQELNPYFKFFLQQNPKDPPDFYGLDLFMNKGYLTGYEREIEVFEFPNESKLELAEEIKKKTSKAYSNKTILVCHITKTNFRESLGVIHEQVSKFNPKNEIWVIASAEDGVHQLVAKVYPNIVKVEVDVKKIVNSESKPAFITGDIGKSGSLTFEDTGRKILLTPQFKVFESKL